MLKLAAAWSGREKSSLSPFSSCVEETQKNDLDIVREVLKITKEVPIERAYDFSFAKKADSELTQAGWKP
jgi:hypothetical protein